MLGLSLEVGNILLQGYQIDPAPPAQWPARDQPLAQFFCSTGNISVPYRDAVKLQLIFPFNYIIGHFISHHHQSHRNSDTNRKWIEISRDPAVLPLRNPFRVYPSDR